MGKITDYRTEAQKRNDALYPKILERYSQLREEGLTHYRACMITGSLRLQPVVVVSSEERQSRRGNRNTLLSDARWGFQRCVLPRRVCAVRRRRACVLHRPSPIDEPRGVCVGYGSRIG